MNIDTPSKLLSLLVLWKKGLSRVNVYMWLNVAL